MGDWFVKKPCKHCPFRMDVRPFLRVERAEGLAFAAQNPYNSFTCHKTLEHDDDAEDGEMLVTQASLECAGFLTLVYNETDRKPAGFTPSPLVYGEAWAMIEAYQDEADGEWKAPPAWMLDADRQP